MTSSSVSVGRVRLAKVDKSQAPGATAAIAPSQSRSFAQTASVMRVMEAVAAAAAQNEAVLLVGETGTGKSTLVQHVANLVRLTTFPLLYQACVSVGSLGTGHDDIILTDHH